MRKYISLRVGKGMISFLVDKKALLITVLLTVLTIFLFLFSTGMGTMKISIGDVIDVILGKGEAMHALVIQSFRLPRILAAILVGMALAVAGAILQGIVRNPLASPDILGITGGAAVAVVLFLTLFSDENNALTVSIKWMPLAAFLGATIIALFIYILAWDNGGVSPLKLVLVGIGLYALTQAITTLLMILGPIYRASQANIWLTGTVYGTNWENVKILAPWTIILLVITFVSTRHLNIQELGDDVATGVGSRVARQRLKLLLLSTGLTGGAVAFAGGIGFVGLLAPHIARRIVGSAFGALLPVSALIGAILVMVSDLIGRTMFGAAEIPAGVFTAAIGAPYFIYLLFKK
ncbi:FecCD family ABC transporter permease [Calidifontibacillus erzurumensis]|uniref:Iron ABC transporter permease n=1 Tax=Calidifontibacillus erzurumensis TaxID=2741433 RepID=A0A8J8GAQ3_9BACI|nr:iron ABC transporter permease [Calidifontibacillus erzurumensis]NSL50237.1 iron ABC transporter permease [Calidifontibacillus erzurumensis]